jgi:subtilase family serine protease
MHVPAGSLPSRPTRRRRGQALAGACTVAALALSGCQGGGPAKPAAATPGAATSTAAPQSGTLSDCLTLAPALCYGVRQFLTAYGVEPLLGRGTDGRGQSVVLLEPTTPNGSTTSDIRRDLALFDGAFGLPAARLQVITRFAGSDSPYLAGGEEAMDAEMVHAVAPAATIRIVVLPHSGQLQATAASVTAALRLAPSLGGVVAITFGVQESCSGSGGVAALNSALEADDDRHVTVIASSGDNGAAGIPCPGSASTALAKGVNLPASDPLVLAAGGTTLQADRQTGGYIGETAWTQPGAQLPAGAPTPPAGSAQAQALAQELMPKASNGGFSILFSRPAYQDGIGGIGNMRGVPDVSADAGETTGMAVAFSLASGNVITAADGTSAAAPFWAGIVALADQYAGHALGFVNPAIYRIGRSPSYRSAFHDITTGGNTVTYPGGTVTGYRAAPGWDPVSGWGSPDAQVLVPLLAAGG